MKRQVSETIRKLRNMILTGFKPIKKRAGYCRGWYVHICGGWINLF